MEKTKSVSQIEIKVTNDITGSYFKKIAESIEAGKDSEETFEIECKAIEEIQQKILDALGIICNGDIGYIVIALQLLAEGLKSKRGNDPLMEIMKAKQIEHLEKRIGILTVQPFFKG